MKFILSRELGRLCKWLRILGYDAEYFKKENKGLLLVEAMRDDRTIVTRNSRMGQARGVRIIKIKSDRIKEQLRQVLAELRTGPKEKSMFSRCIHSR